MRGRSSTILAQNKAPGPTNKQNKTKKKEEEEEEEEEKA